MKYERNGAEGAKKKAQGAFCDIVKSGIKLRVFLFSFSTDWSPIQMHAQKNFQMI
jgi:hypothetical protein